MKTIKIFIVPGFFGFNDIGTYNYFFRVKESLSRALAQMAPDRHYEIIECITLPTSSIRRRALFLLNEVINAQGDQADELYFIGHSTGGLDVRMLLTPGVKLEEGSRESEVQKRTKAVITISTPHYGTPLASFFTTLQGRQILRLLVALAGTRAGKLSVFTMAQSLKLVSRFDEFIGRQDTFFDQLNRRLLKSIDMDPNNPIWKFLEDVGSDQGAILQLTQEAMDLFNAGVTDLPHTDYFCVLTGVKKARILNYKTLISTKRFATRLLFLFLQTIASREHRHYPYPLPADYVAKTILDDLNLESLDPTVNDGIVPLLSQVHGQILGTFEADHLDIVGHFYLSGGEPLSDWLSSGSNFDEARFQEVWQTVAQAICGR